VALRCGFIVIYSFYAECLALIGEAAGEPNTSDHSTFRQILSLKSVHILAFFTLVYVGVEVTIGGTHDHISRFVD
jgi:fucose permease